MPAAGHIGVGIFVDEQKLRATLECAIEIKLPHDLIAVDHWRTRENFETLDQLLCFASAMSLDQSGNDMASAEVVTVADARSEKRRKSEERGVRVEMSDLRTWRDQLRGTDATA